MTLLSGTDLKKSFLGETLFENVSFDVYASDKIGFIGVNGAGKSTLFKIIIGQADPDGGEVFKSRETKIAYLEQYPDFDGSRTVMDEMLTGFPEVVRIEQELDAIHRDLEDARGDVHALAARQAALQERFSALGGLVYRSRIKSALMGLGFAESELSMPLDKISGGQRTRIALCRVLLSDADLLLLDEPTNHLDIASVEWLEDFLIDSKKAFIVISHDRYFLDRVTKKTFALENGHLRSYNGNYSAYAAQREIDRLTEERNYDFTVREIHRLEEVVEQQRRWKHKKNKKTHTLDNTRKAIERLENTLVEPESTPEAVRFRFTACAGGAKRVLEAKDLGMAFDGSPLFEHVDLLIQKGEKVFLLGPNGCGKTTLIKLLMGIYQPTSGECRTGENIRVGYYDQRKENLHREKTIISEIWDDQPGLTQTQIRSALALLLFKGEDVFKEIRTLSGGELARVALTKLLLEQTNLLILDEPTNHLDIASREALEAALADYDGTMLVVSHDRYFINKLSDRILYLTPSGVESFEGKYDDLLSARQMRPAAEKSESTPSEKGNDYRERKRMEAERRKIRNRSAKLEELIEQTEASIRSLTEASEAPETATDYVKLSQIAGQIESLQQSLDGYLEEWEALQQTIEEME